MKLLSGYIKRNLIWLCLIFLITMLHLGYMLLINVKSADIGYSIILDLMITAVVFIIGFVLYAKKVKKLGKILEHPRIIYLMYFIRNLTRLLVLTLHPCALIRQRSFLKEPTGEWILLQKKLDFPAAPTFINNSKK